MRFVLALFFLCLGWGGANSAQFTQEEKQALVQTLATLNIRLEAGDVSALAETMPPRLYKEMAVLLQQSVEALQADFITRLQAQFGGDGLEKYHFDGDLISYHETKSGSFYALVPTYMEMQDTIREFKTLALYDESHWYLIQGGQKTVQNPVFLEIYPFLAEIVIPPAQITKKSTQ